MGLMDELKGAGAKAQELLAEHEDQAKAAVDKVEHLVDEKTGGKHHDQIASAADKVEGFIDKQSS